jgi:hypothetical protein
MISDEDAERAVDFLRDNARRTAQAKANSEYMSEFRKVLKARIMREHESLPLGAQEREAYADPRYEQHLRAMQTAIEESEYQDWMMDAAETKISAWQTLSKNARV